MLIKLIVGMAFIGFTCSANADEAISFNSLPDFIKGEVGDVRAACMKDEHGVIFWHEMQGIQTFYLPQDKNLSILVDDRHVCNTQTKGGNCHTWVVVSCDVSIYRGQLRSPSSHFRMRLSSSLRARILSVRHIAKIVGYTVPPRTPDDWNSHHLSRYVIHPR
jgi:hypothetical protein